LKVYPGAPHGLTFTHKEQFNADVRYALVMQGERLVGLMTLSDIRHISREL
jgi:hypothetical protein